MSVENDEKKSDDDQQPQLDQQNSLEESSQDQDEDQSSSQLGDKVHLMDNSTHHIYDLATPEGRFNKEFHDLKIALVISCVEIVVCVVVGTVFMLRLYWNWLIDLLILLWF